MGGGSRDDHCGAHGTDSLGGGSSGLEAWYSTGSRERAPTQYFDLASQDDGPSRIPVESASGQAGDAPDSGSSVGGGAL